MCTGVTELEPQLQMGLSFFLKTCNDPPAISAKRDTFLVFLSTSKAHSLKCGSDSQRNWSRVLSDLTGPSNKNVFHMS